MVTKATALPGDDGARLDEEQVVTPAGPGTGQAGSQDPAGRYDPRPAAGSLVDRELMAQCNDFELQRQTRKERRGEKAGEEQETRSHAHL